MFTIDLLDVPNSSWGDINSIESKRYAPRFIPIPGDSLRRKSAIRSDYPKVSGTGKRPTGKENVSIGGSERMSTALVRPGDIEAIDSKDLLSQMLSSNIESVTEKNMLRERKDWVEKEKGKIRKAYYAKAQAAYERIWEACDSSKVGHDFIQVEIRGENVKECKVCTFHKSAYNKPRDNYSSSNVYRSSADRAVSANDDLIEVLARRMVVLDEEAGILTWPTEDEAPSYALSKRKRFFR